MNQEPAWLEVARKEIGIHELAGSQHSLRILEYGQSTVLKTTTDEMAWCSAFVNWCFAQVGINGTRSAVGRSWLKWGRSILDPVPGCVAVLKRGHSPRQGHVGFFVSKDPDGHIELLGGNQKDSVCIQKFSSSQVLSYRMPEERKVA